MNSKSMESAASAVIGLVVAALLVAALYFVMGLGKKAEQLKQAKAENQALTAATQRITLLQKQVRTQEEAHALALRAISTQYQKDLQHVQSTGKQTVADVRSGALRLHAPVAACPAGGGDSPGQTGTSPGRRDGEARAELSGAVAEDLVTLASDADTIVHQLTACQAIVRADRQQQAQVQP